MTAKTFQTNLYIQALRAVAASVVVVFHSIGTSQHYISAQESGLLSVFRYGDVGVDLFFVISGFIIYHSTRQTKFSAGEFLRHRLTRIVPLYWVATALFVALLTFGPKIIARWQLDYVNAVCSLFFVSFATGQWPVVYVGWSLEFEVFFYLSVAIFLRRGEVAWNAIVYLFSFLALCHYELRAVSPSLEFFTNPRILEFCYGILIGLTIDRKTLPLAPIAAVSVATVIDIGVDWPHYFLWAGVASAALVALAAIFDPRDRAPTSVEKVAARVGDASYSIYLFQVFLISGFCKFTARFAPSIDILILACSVFTIAGGFVIYVQIERPLLRVVRTLAAASSATAPRSRA